jgi:choline dehydrogenase-like flavoprotein
MAKPTGGACAEEQALKPDDPFLQRPEYIVVGSGAGGATVAARLAESGHTVVLLEAGGDAKAAGGDREKRLPEDYDVPCFHPFASENDAMKWDFFVRHYSDDGKQRSDPNYRETWEGRRVDGVLYPRAGTLGGCTAHNAMILVYPHDEDWKGIEELTHDASWNAKRMRRYFECLEDCHHRPVYRAHWGANSLVVARHARPERLANSEGELVRHSLSAVDDG